MSYRNINYVPVEKEYAHGTSACISRVHAMSQYRHPDKQRELRKGDVPSETCNQPLYLKYPRMGIPEYRGRFRDKPWGHSHHFPNEDPNFMTNANNSLTGFYNRIYDDAKSQPRFKYEGGRDNRLSWIERPPYTNSVTQLRQRQSHPDFKSMKAEYKRVHFPRVVYRNQVDYLAKTQLNTYP